MPTGCPLLAQSGHLGRHFLMSAYDPPKADIEPNGSNRRRSDQDSAGTESVEALDLVVRVIGSFEELLAEEVSTVQPSC